MLTHQSGLLLRRRSIVPLATVVIVTTSVLSCSSGGTGSNAGSGAGGQSGGSGSLPVGGAGAGGLVASSTGGAGSASLGSGGITGGMTGMTGGGSAAGGALGLAGATTGGVAGSGGATGGGGATAIGGAVGSGGAGSGGTSGGSGDSLPWLKVVGTQIQIEATGQQVILRGLSLQGIGTQNDNAVIDYLTNTNDSQGTSPGWYPKMLRLPVDTPNENNEINGVLKSTVDYATKKGLYAIIDLHYVANPYQNDAAVKSFWTIVAPMFKDYPNVIYEPFNESSVQDTWATYKPTMQAWVDLIRSYAPKNLIFAGSPSWDQTMGDAGLNPLTGENIVYVVHMYAQHYATAWNREQAEACAKYHPVAMTEWGFNDDPNQPGDGTNLIGSYGQPMLTWLEAMGGSWTAWCASSSWLPDMFTGTGPQNWVLRTGQDNMGGFVKDWLYTHRSDNAPL